MRNSRYFMRMTQKDIKIIHPELSYNINGVLFQAKKESGRFKNEKQYCDAIEAILKKKDIKYEREKILPPSFRGELTGRKRRYLSCFNKKLAILVNMRNYYIKPKRILNPEIDE